MRIAPEFVHRIWGTRDLSPFFGEPPGTEAIGEVWLTGEECKVANGPLAGRAIGDLAREFGRELVGETAPQADRFPLLLKFLYPREKLSVQVHPDDDAAKKVGLPCGKTECWYVLQAAPGAQVGLGLKPGTTKQDFERAIREVRAEDLLNWIDIHKGDMIYVDAGTVHAIAPGSVLLETQQNSDTTYRLYDYGRPRELHIEQGMAAMKETTAAGKAVPQDDILVISPCFQVERQVCSDRDREGIHYGEQAMGGGPWPSMRIFVALSGCGVFEGNGFDAVMFHAGDAVVVPSVIEDFDLQPHWDLEFMRVHIPPSGASKLSSIVRPEHFLNVIRDQRG